MLSIWLLTAVSGGGPESRGVRNCRETARVLLSFRSGHSATTPAIRARTQRAAKHACNVRRSIRANGTVAYLGQGSDTHCPNNILSDSSASILRLGDRFRALALQAGGADGPLNANSNRIIYG